MRVAQFPNFIPLPVSLAAASHRKPLHASNSSFMGSLYEDIRYAFNKTLAQYHDGDYLLAWVFDQTRNPPVFVSWSENLARPRKAV